MQWRHRRIADAEVWRKKGEGDTVDKTDARQT